jgi:hypothetical protein
MLNHTNRLRTTSFFATLIIMTLLAGCKPKQQTLTPEPVVSTPPAALPMNYISTFQLARPERMELEYYAKMSDQRDSIPAQKKKEITDGAQLDEFVAITSRLADKGDMMIKMGDVPLLHVILYYPDQKLYFTFYQSRVKTPDTSFYANSPQNEKDLHEFLFSLLNK